jgi:hypothetical protein
VVSMADNVVLHDILLEEEYKPIMIPTVLTSAQVNNCIVEGFFNITELLE